MEEAHRAVVSYCIQKSAQCMPVDVFRHNTRPQDDIGIYLCKEFCCLTERGKSSSRDLNGHGLKKATISYPGIGSSFWDDEVDYVLNIKFIKCSCNNRKGANEIDMLILRGVLLLHTLSEQSLKSLSLAFHSAPSLFQLFKQIVAPSVSRFLSHCSESPPKKILGALPHPPFLGYKKYLNLSAQCRSII